MSNFRQCDQQTPHLPPSIDEWLPADRLPRSVKARADDQANLTDPDSRIMPLAGGGFEQCYNGQAAVDTETLLVVASGLPQAANDKRQLAPMMSALNALPEALDEVVRMLADAGYYSAANITACVNVGIEPMLAGGREAHHPSWQARASASRRRW